MDDIDPVPHAGHAAILRSPFAHARVNALDPARALALPGVIGVLTGADVARLSRPFAVGVPDAPPYLAAAHEIARYAGEPLAVVVARDRYIAEDALELIEVDLEPLDAVADPDAGEVVSDRSFTLRGRRECLRARGPRRLRTVPDAALVLQSGRDLRCRRRLEPSGGHAHGLGQLPGAVHAALGGGRRPRPTGIQPASDHPARLGRKLRRQGGRLHLHRPARARVAPPRHPRPLDRGPARAPRRRLAGDRAQDGARGGVRRGRRAARAALRRARGRGRVPPRARTGDALPDARLAVGGLPRSAPSPRGTASCSRTAVRRG